VRKALLSVVVGLAGAAVVVSAGWAFQTVALPAPARADRVAADAEAWLNYYRLSVDVFHADGDRVEGACLHGWYPRRHERGRHGRRHRRVGRGSLLVLAHGSAFLASGKKQRIRLLFGHGRADLPAFLAVAIGCTGSLANALTRAAQANMHLRIERAYAANQPALALKLHPHDERLTMYLSPRKYRPLVVLGAVGGRTAAVRLYLTSVTPSRAANFRRLLQRGGLRVP
jgi:hypothetical protein